MVFKTFMGSSIYSFRSVYDRLLPVLQSLISDQFAFT